eukprot:871197-Prorocentrum_minimum.AAC.2
MSAQDASPSSPGVDGQKGLRLQFKSRQLSTVDSNCHMAGRQSTPGLAHLGEARHAALLGLHVVAAHPLVAAVVRRHRQL